LKSIENTTVTNLSGSTTVRGVVTLEKEEKKKKKKSKDNCRDLEAENTNTVRVYAILPQLWYIVSIKVSWEGGD
jgi:hypothetical protein